MLAGVGMSGFYLLGASTVAHWFVASRGLALAIVLVGFNLGYITGGPLAAWLIDKLGWRHAYAGSRAAAGSSRWGPRCPCGCRAARSARSAMCRGAPRPAPARRRASAGRDLA